MYTEIETITIKTPHENEEKRSGLKVYPTIPINAKITPINSNPIATQLFL